MKKIDFNQAWTFCRVGEETVKHEVMIPHDAMISEKRTEDSAGGINTGWFEGYDYIYEKEFEIPDEYEKQEISFEFEGVYHNAEVYLNGEKAAYRPYGYTNFYIDADPYLKYGEKNQIRVIAHNADQPNSRWYSGAGIYRPVWMYVRPKQHILRNEIRVRTLSVDPAVIEAEVNTNAPGEVKLEVIADAGSDVIIAAEIHTDGKLTKQFEIPDAKLWSVNTPNLYRLRVTFAAEQENGQNKYMETDQEEVIFGIRTLKWDKETGITINGERVILRGACIHHDNGVLGACCYPDAEARKIRILKENGYNAIRSAHNPCSKALLEACDRQGMLVMDEFVDVWYIHKTEYDYVNYFKEWYGGEGFQSSICDSLFYRK